MTMTPADRARLIDKQEFEAECRAIRERALSYAAAKRQAERARFKSWLGRSVEPDVIRPGLKPGRKSQTLTLNGVTKTLSEWSICTGLAINTIRSRLRLGFPIEEALRPGKLTNAGTLHTVNGESRTLREWAAHIGIRYEALIARMNKGRTLAEALAMPKGSGRRKPGVVSNFPAFEGTGAGSTAQEIPEMDFSEKVRTA